MQRNTMSMSRLPLKNVRFHGKLINETAVANFIVCDVIKSYWDTRNGKVVKLSNISHGTCVNLSRAFSLCNLTSLAYGLKA
jgi:hypothetical protein